MSDAEEMLLATVNRHRNASDQAKADPETPADASTSVSNPQENMPTSEAETAPEQNCAPAAPTSPAWRPLHEGAHVRTARLSTSDARKADHELSSSIVAMSSGTVGSEPPPETNMPYTSQLLTC